MKSRSKLQRLLNAEIIREISKSERRDTCDQPEVKDTLALAEVT